MAAAFGVHFGSTSACLAVHRDGNTSVVANDAGDRTTPAIVAFTDHERLVGLSAKQGIIRNASNTVCQSKKLVGRAFNDPVVHQYCESNKVKVVEQSGQPAFEVEFKEKTSVQSVEHVVAAIYSKMMETAQSHGGQGIHDAVLTAPTDFSTEQRNALKSAAETAGFNVLRIISEPSAAALAYDIGQLDSQQLCNVMVYRVGGCSMEVAVISVIGGFYRMLSDVQKPIGGATFTEAVVKHFVSEFKRQSRLDASENSRAMAKLRSGSERCKHILSNLQAAPCHIDSLHEGIDFQSSLARSRFEMLASSIVREYIEPMTEAIEQAGLASHDIQKVILCGGSTNIPFLVNQVQAVLPQAELLNTISPEEVIAVGAAKQAAILAGGEESVETDCQLECLSNCLQVQLKNESGEFYQTVFPENTPIPARCHEVYPLANQQSTFSLELYEGGHKELVRTLLGRVVMRDMEEGSQVNVVYHIRREGSVHITCTEKCSGRQESLTVEVAE